MNMLGQSAIICYNYVSFSELVKLHVANTAHERELKANPP